MSDVLSDSSYFPFYVNSEDRNLELAITCLRYLSFDEFDMEPMIDRIPRWSFGNTSTIFILEKNYPLLNYAALYWSLHTLQLNEEDSHLWKSFWRLAHSPRKMNLVHKIFIFSQFKSFHNDDPKYTEPLQILACHGLVASAKKLLDSGVAINTQSRNKTNALHVAIKFRRQPMAKLLLDRKADVNIESGRYKNALETAAAIGTKEAAQISGEVVTVAANNPDNGAQIMEVLLSREADVEISMAAIAIILRKFDQKIIKLLLAKNDSFNITNDVVTALVWNLSNKNEVMGIFLSRDASKVTIAVAAFVTIITHLDEEFVLNLLCKDFNLEISAEVIATLARRCTAKAMNILLAIGGNFVITEQVATACAQNYSSASEVMEGYWMLVITSRLPLLVL
ncbi:hypothetical protein BDD12DRAFT_807060 [Trichophaea hybrida]|nr:hypothetical protein BDD12DRAFT_807060 [Trichophaea hybrida]